MNYQAYLRSPEWAKKRRRIIIRAGGRCERCHLWPVTFVHHLTYAHIGNERDEELLGVCALCHKELHPERE